MGKFRSPFALCASYATTIGSQKWCRNAVSIESKAFEGHAIDDDSTFSYVRSLLLG